MNYEPETLEQFKENAARYDLFILEWAAEMGQRILESAEARKARLPYCELCENMRVFKAREFVVIEDGVGTEPDKGIFREVQLRCSCEPARQRKDLARFSSLDGAITAKREFWCMECGEVKLDLSGRREPPHWWGRLLCYRCRNAAIANPFKERVAIVQRALVEKKKNYYAGMTMEERKNHMKALLKKQAEKSLQSTQERG